MVVEFFGVRRMIGPGQPAAPVGEEASRGTTATRVSSVLSAVLPETSNGPCFLK